MKVVVIVLHRSLCSHIFMIFNVIDLGLILIKVS